MAKIFKKSNFRVLVEPKRLGNYGSVRTSDNFLRTEQQVEKDYQRRCDEIVEQIKRHVDDVDSANVEYDSDPVCSLCGSPWEQDENGMPLCCEKAEKEFVESKEQIVNS